MQSNFFVRCSLNGQHVTTNHYTDEKEALNAAKALMVAQGKKMNIGEYLSAIRTGKHNCGYHNRNYRTLLARYLREFFSSPEVSPMQSEDVCGEDPNDYVGEENADRDSFDDVLCMREAGCTVVEFRFDGRLMIDSNFLTCPTSTYGYFRIKDATTDFKVNIDRYDAPWFYTDGSSKSQNLLLVYAVLTETPKTLKDIQRDICENTCADVSDWVSYKAPTLISTKTIGGQLLLLQKLGFPIAYTYRSGTDLDPTRPGFHIEPHSLCSIPDVDASALGSSVYLMLVIITLLRTRQEYRASEIIDYIAEHFRVRMSKSTVLRHLRFLTALGVIEQHNEAYIWH